MALRKSKIGQTKFEIYDPLKNIPKNHVCFLVKKIVDREDFTEINSKYMNTPGTPAFDRKILAYLVLMGAVEGIFASRRLSEATYRDDVYKYLSGMEHPDFNTICRFKHECKDMLSKLFAETVKFGIEEGIVQMQNISLDGTTMKACASKNSRITQEDIDIAKELIEKSIKLDEEENLLYNNKSGEIISQETMDKIGDKKGEFRRIKTAVKNIVNQSHKNKKQSLKKLDNAEEQLKIQKTDKISLTDPESNWMPNKQYHFELLYNLQITYDYDSRIIIDNRIADNPTDMNEFIPGIESLKNKIGEINQNTIITVDNGFYSGKNLEFIENNDLNAIIPNKAQASIKKGNKVDPFSKHYFKYDFENDNYKCPNNEILEFKNQYSDGRKVYYNNKCKQCPFEEKCKKSQNTKVISAYKNEQLMQKMKINYQENTEEYQKRGPIEGIFGHIKYNMKFNQFYRVGKEKTQTDSDIISFAHNIRRIHNIINENIKENRVKNSFYT